MCYQGLVETSKFKRQHNKSLKEVLQKRSGGWPESQVYLALLHTSLQLDSQISSQAFHKNTLKEKVDFVARFGSADSFQYQNVYLRIRMCKICDVTFSHTFISYICHSLSCVQAIDDLKHGAWIPDSTRQQVEMREGDSRTVHELKDYTIYL